MRIYTVLLQYIAPEVFMCALDQIGECGKHIFQFSFFSHVGVSFFILVSSLVRRFCITLVVVTFQIRKLFYYFFSARFFVAYHFSLVHRYCSLVSTQNSKWRYSGCSTHLSAMPPWVEPLPLCLSFNFIIMSRDGGVAPSGQRAISIIAVQRASGSFFFVYYLYFYMPLSRFRPNDNNEYDIIIYTSPFYTIKS